MKELIGVINKPQFNMDTFKLGQAIHVKAVAHNGFVTLNTDGLIHYANPLYLEVTYFDAKEEVFEEFKKIKISIEDVIAEKYKINLLKESS